MAWKGTCRGTSPGRQARHLSNCNSEARKISGPQESNRARAMYSTPFSKKKTLAYRHDQSYCFIAASNASGSKSNERSKLESGSALEPFLPLPSSCRRCRCESCECDGVQGICGLACEAALALAAAAAGRARGGRKGFFVAAE
jgi:hypothetical protein